MEAGRVPERERVGTGHVREGVGIGEGERESGEVRVEVSI